MLQFHIIVVYSYGKTIYRLVFFNKGASTRNCRLFTPQPSVILFLLEAIDSTQSCLFFISLLLDICMQISISSCCLHIFCAHSPISVLCPNNICHLKTILRVNIESAEQNEFCPPSTFFLMLLFSNGWNIRSLIQIRPMISNFVQLEMVQRNAVAIADYIIDRLINWLREPPDKVHFAESF